MTARTKKRSVNFLLPFLKIFIIIFGILFLSLVVLKIINRSNQNLLGTGTQIGPITATLVNPIIPKALGTYDQWKAFYQGIKDMGIDTVIITQTGYIKCPDKKFVNYLEDDDKNAISAAFDKGLNVYIGTLAKEDCLNPQHDATDQEIYLTQNKLLLILLRDFLSNYPANSTTKYINRVTFKGFYISPESAITEYDKPIVYQFNQRVGKQINDMFSYRKVLVSPYFADPDITATTAKSKFKVFLDNTPNVHIIAPQDMGAGRAGGNYISPDQSRLLYSAMASLFTEYPDKYKYKSFWANIEPEKYDSTYKDGQFIPKSNIEDIGKQIDAVYSSASKVMMWIYQLSFMPADQGIISANSLYDEKYALMRQQLRFDYFAKYINLDTNFVVLTSTHFQNENIRSVKIYAPLMSKGQYVTATVYYLSNDGKTLSIKKRVLSKPLTQFEGAEPGVWVVRVPITDLGSLYVTGSQIDLGVTK